MQVHSTFPSQPPVQPLSCTTKNAVCLQKAASINSPDEDNPMPIEHLISYTDDFKAGHRHMLFVNGKDYLKENFLDYWGTIGIVSALLLGISLSAATSAPEPHKSLKLKTGKLLHKVFISMLLLSSMFSTATVMMCTVFYIRLGSCVGMEGIVDFITKYPYDVPDIFNVIASVLFAISLFVLVYLMLPAPWSHIVGFMLMSLLIFSSVVIVWVILDGKADRDYRADQYFEEVNALFEDAD